MPELIERISDNSDWLLWVIIILIIPVLVVFFWELSQDPQSPRNIFDIAAILATLLTLGYSHYQSNRRIEELRKTRLQPEYEERRRIIDEAIEAAQENINRLSYDEEDEFTGDFEKVLDLGSLPPNHQKYFEKNHPDFVNDLKNRQKHERELGTLRSKVRRNLRNEREVDIFVEDHLGSNPDSTDWLIDQILTFSKVTEDELEDEFGIVSDTGRAPVQQDISSTQRNRGSGIFLHAPQPDWMREYVETKDEAIEYFQQQIKTLEEIKRDQTV